MHRCNPYFVFNEGFGSSPAVSRPALFSSFNEIVTRREEAIGKARSCHVAENEMCLVERRGFGSTSFLRDSTIDVFVFVGVLSHTLQTNFQLEVINFSLFLFLLTVQITDAMPLDK